jgi:HJR/Mrr/RecB family endonuclease
MSARLFAEQRWMMPRFTPAPARSRRRSHGHWLVAGMTLLFLGWASFRIGVRPDWIHELPVIWSELLSLLEMAFTLTLTVLWGAVLWSRLQEKPVQYIASLEDLQALSPKEFEAFVAFLFRQKGYAVKMRGRSGDRGVDLELLKPEGKRAIVQCKRYSNAIGPDIARELYGTLIHEESAHAFLVTTADISDATRQWAEGKSMTLIDGKTLAQLAADLRLKASGMAT